jgi:hypothetical protein
MMMQRGEHLTVEGLQSIVNIRASSPPKERSIYPSPPVVVMGLLRRAVQHVPVGYCAGS